MLRKPTDSNAGVGRIEDIDDIQQRQRAIGAAIRKSFAAVVSEEVPRFLLDCLADLEAKGKARGGQRK
jgi:hypothetical protein